MSTAHRPHIGLDVEANHPRTREQGAEQHLFGFWIFMMSDLVLFALLLATYASMSAHGLAGMPGPNSVVELRSVFIETMLLLASSFTFGLASLALKYGRDSTALLVWLAVTVALGLGFVAMEIHDFAGLAAKGLVPQASGYLSSFYLLVMTHGFHVSVGAIWVLVLMHQVVRLGLEPPVRIRLMRASLYWHMLDIVWVAILTFVFLKGAL